MMSMCVSVIFVLLRPDAVYQVHIPQLAVEAEEDTLNIQPPYDIINMLETDKNSEKITLDLFTELTGIKQNAKEVFNDWDLNGKLRGNEMKP